MLGLCICFILSSLAEVASADYLSSGVSSFKSEYLISSISSTHYRLDQLQCTLACLREASCNAAIFHESSDICYLGFLDDGTKNMLRKGNGRFLYMVMLSKSISQVYYEVIKNKVYESCKDLKRQYPNAPSGIYRIAPGKNAPFQAYCDQATAGGGWTLVWSYTFTNYLNFEDKSNAVTPLPDWRASCGARVSTRAPLNETQYDAIRFQIWQDIGKEFLVKSNINNWYRCKPSDGSLVLWIEGKIICKKVKTVAAGCISVPSILKIMGCGPALLKLPRRPGSCKHPIFFHFEGSVSRDWPIHNPCPNCRQSHLSGVNNPHGNLYIR
ncbi:uncharacterized protein LOC5517094 [Nematostella vectensis]|uniref:uncharacterized protein LOC5517094 n=1 Tax=Nematostella vectensis TaxID=45351 RepID=UPI00139024F8|nr:uncharacterized protein LOC5517094 [Nematostella vectensis]